jgi:hypothetical protein
MAALQRGWEQGRSLPVMSAFEPPASDTTPAQDDPSDSQAQPEGGSQ